jgi:putative transposase
MPRKARNPVGDVIYHVLNRANARQTIFQTRGDYEAFERVVEEAREQVSTRILDYCVMPNHWHLVLWPEFDKDLSRFVSWLSMTHTQRWHSAHDTTGMGHLYQGRFKDFPIESDQHYLTVCRYVERNPVRAGLVRRAEDWPYSGLYRRTKGDASARALLNEGPVDWPSNWLDIVNEPQPEREEEMLRECAQRGRPFGSDYWVNHAVERFGRRQTLRLRGRPLGSGRSEDASESAKP